MNATRINITLGTKGGVGKTTVALHLADWFNQIKADVWLVDLDEENGTLRRFLPHAQHGDVHNESEVDALVVAADEQGYDLLLADLKAGSGVEMLAWFRGLPFEALAERGIRFTGFACITTDPDSVTTLLRWAYVIGNRIDYIVVRNYRDGQEIHALDRTSQGLDFIEQCRPRFIELPQLRPRYQAEINSRSLTLSGVIRSQDPIPGLTNIMVRHRLKEYQAAIFKQFEAHRDFILP
jgi:hypothetical protein